MRYLRQLGIILLFSLAGELLRELIPLPIPAGIYGFVLLFAGLCTGAVKLRQVERVSDFLIEIMQVILMPACIVIIDYWGEVRQSLAALAVISIVSTAAVMAVTGKVSDLILDRKERAGK